MTGVTCVLAWPLPYSPSYPDFEYENGDIPFSHFDRKDDNITMASTATGTTTASGTHSSNATESIDSTATNEMDEALWQFFNYLEQNRRPDSFYFGAANAVHVPYSPEYAAYGQYDLFTKYLIDSYFKPMPKFDVHRKRSALSSSTTITTTTAPT